MGNRLGILLAAALMLSACTGGDAGDGEQVAPVPADEAEAAEEGGRTLVEEAPTPTPTATPVAVEPSELNRPIPEGGNTTESFGPLGDSEAEFETDEGSVQIGSGDVPAGAAEFPVPDDLQIQLASETEADLGFTGVTAMEFAELVAFYQEGIPAAGFEILGSEVAEGVFAVFTFESETQVGQVAISQAPGFDGWTVLVNLGDGVGDEEQLPDLVEDDDSAEG